MAIRYNMGRKGKLRNGLYKLRRSLPKGLRLRVWKRTAGQVFERMGYAQHVPLFRSIELETRTRCNSSCSFCAASILTDQRPDIYMPQELYTKLLNELVTLDYNGAIKFFVNNEPLLDKRTPDFIRQAKAVLPNVRTEVHTNGLKLNPKSGRELLEAGLDLLYINNYTQEGKMHLGVTAFLKEVAPEFPQVEVVFHMRLLDEQLLNRGGTAPNGKVLAEPLPLPCILPFDEVVVTADGRVTICCQDHYFEAAVGNLNERSLQDIWYGPGSKPCVHGCSKTTVQPTNFAIPAIFEATRRNTLHPSNPGKTALWGLFWMIFHELCRKFVRSLESRPPSTNFFIPNLNIHATEITKSVSF